MYLEISYYSLDFQDGIHMWPWEVEKLENLRELYLMYFTMCISMDIHFWI